MRISNFGLRSFLLLALLTAHYPLLTAQQARYQRRGNGAPSNPCTVGATASEVCVDSATGKRYGCKSSDGSPSTSGTWIEATAAGSGTPGDSSGQLQFANAGVFSGVAGTAVSTTYASLNAAVTAIGSTPTTLTIPAGFALGTSPVTVPSTLTLQFLPGGSITGTGALTINSSLVANLSNPSQIFGTSITVTLGNGQTAILPEWYGAVGDGSTDDTTAINATIVSALTAKSATIRLQNKTYLVTALSIPASSGEWTSLQIEGPVHPPFLQGTGLGGNTHGVHGAIILRTSTASSAILSAAGWFDGTVTLKNMTFRREDNPNGAGVDGTNLVQLVMEGVQVDTNVTYTNNVTEPSHAGASGIVFPTDGNASESIGRDLLVQGYYNGIVWAEHTELDYVQIAACENAILLPGASHPLYGTRVLVQNSKYVLTFTNTQASRVHLILSELGIEHGVVAGFPAWQATTYDFNDVSNLGYGQITYLIDGNPANNALINGATNLKISKLGENPTLVRLNGGGVQDTALSRISAGIVGVGTGAAGSTAGGLQAATLSGSTSLTAPLWKPASDSTSALIMANAAGTPLISVDTRNQQFLFSSNSVGEIARFTTTSTVSGVLAINTGTNGNATVGLYNASAAKWYFGNLGSSSNAFRITAGDAIGNPTLFSLPQAATGAVTFGGTNYTTGGCASLAVTITTGVITCTASDEKVKQNINPLRSSSLDVLSKVHPITFEYRHGTAFFSGRKQEGLSAQNLQRADPLLVSTFSQDGQVLLQPEWMGLHAREIGAINELRQIVSEQKSEIEMLKEAVKRLERRPAVKRR